MKTIPNNPILKTSVPSTNREVISKEKTYSSEIFIALAHDLGKTFEERASAYDQNDQFVDQNYEALKEHRIFAALIPQQFGGLGQSHSDVANFLRVLAQYCGSTALALSMHQHLVGVNVWKSRHGKGGEAVLQRVAKEQIVLVSTGARDWLDSNGEMKKVKGGYILNAYKAFASQSIVGDVFVTSAPFQDPEKGPVVLHFPVPANADGVTVKDSWYTLGMRSTGSHGVEFKDVFVPESAIALARPQGQPHMVYNLVLTVAMPLIMAVYTGIAEAAAQKAFSTAKAKKQSATYLPQLIGEMNNLLINSRVLYEDMLRMCNDFDFAPSSTGVHGVLSRKVVLTKSVIGTVEKAMEIVGGQGFFRSYGLEKLFRDIQASHYHPLPEKEQQQFTGCFLLKEASTI